MKREMICIGCPLGCQLCAKLTETGEFVSVSGNTCKRGAEYARTECTDPRRTLTTTLRCADGGVVAVKTEQPIPKDRLLEAMKQLNQMYCAIAGLNRRCPGIGCVWQSNRGVPEPAKGLKDPAFTVKTTDKNKKRGAGFP